MPDHCKFCGAVTAKNCRSDKDYQSCAFLADIASDEAWASKSTSISTALDDVAGWLENEGRAKHARHVRAGISAIKGAEARGMRRGREEFATALAEAKAQATRDAFEEAAKLIGPHGPRPCDCEPWGCCCQNPGDTAAVAAWDQETALAAAIRALATAPAETEKPETGEASDGR